MRANLKAKEGNSNTSVLEDPMQQIRKKRHGKSIVLT